jgi:hypothetical protein
LKPFEIRYATEEKIHVSSRYRFPELVCIVRDQTQALRE